MESGPILIHKAFEGFKARGIEIVQKLKETLEWSIQKIKESIDEKIQSVIEESPIGFDGFYERI